MSECPSKTSSSFCAYPWIQLSCRSNGAVNLCCSDYGKATEDGRLLKLGRESLDQIWNSEYHRKARLDFLNGRRRSECRRCYFEEDMGIESARLRTLKQYQSEIEQASERGVFKESLLEGRTSEKPFDFDLMLGNKCNLECVMCDTMTSSRMNKSMTDLAKVGVALDQREFPWLAPQPQSEFDWIENEAFWKDLYERTPSIRKVCATGGEPTLVPQVAVLFKHILEAGNPSQVYLVTSTNALVYNKELMDIMNDPRWGLSQLQVSLDGVGETQEYIRYPSRWEAVWKNFEKICANQNISVTVNFVLQAYNLENLLPFLTWMAQHAHLVPAESVIVRFLKEPQHLQALLVADSVKAKVRRDLETHMEREDLRPWKDLLKAVHSYLGEDHDPEILQNLRGRFMEVTQFLDKNRNKDVHLVLNGIEELQVVEQ